jgi:hypothetical protein
MLQAIVRKSKKGKSFLSMGALKKKRENRSDLVEDLVNMNVLIRRIETRNNKHTLPVDCDPNKGTLRPIQFKPNSPTQIHC